MIVSGKKSKSVFDESSNFFSKPKIGRFFVQMIHKSIRGLKLRWIIQN